MENLDIFGTKRDSPDYCSFRSTINSVIFHSFNNCSIQLFGSEARQMVLTMYVALIFNHRRDFLDYSEASLNKYSGRVITHCELIEPRPLWNKERFSTIWRHGSTNIWTLGSCSPGAVTATLWPRAGRSGAPLTRTGSCAPGARVASPCTRSGRSLLLLPVPFNHPYLITTSGLL